MSDSVADLVDDLVSDPGEFDPTANRGIPWGGEPEPEPVPEADTRWWYFECKRMFEEDGQSRWLRYLERCPPSSSSTSLSEAALVALMD